MPEVAEVRGRGFMVGIDLGEHDPALRVGHRVTLEARQRGAIIRPLGDTIVLMPPLSISEADLRRLVEIAARVDRGGACASAAPAAPPRLALEAACPSAAEAPILGCDGSRGVARSKGVSAGSMVATAEEAPHEADIAFERSTAPAATTSTPTPRASCATAPPPRR